MFTPEKLAQLLHELPEVLVVSDPLIPPRILEYMQVEAEFNVVMLKAIGLHYSQNQNSLSFETDLRNILLQRALYIRNWPQDYTNDPHFPLNRLFLQIAQEIAAPQESVFSVLMPYSEGLCRESYSHKSETEDENGYFYPEYFLSRQNQLIPIIEVYEYLFHHPEAVMANETSPYNFVPGEIERLQNAAGVAGANYWAALRQKFEIQNQHSLGCCLKELAKSLHTASVNGLGDEAKAHHKSLIQSVKSFYPRWQQFTLDESVTDLILVQWGAENKTLKEYVLTVFVHYISDCMKDSEREEALTAEIFPCAYQISRALDEFLVRCPDLYKVVADPQSQACDTEKTLTDLKNNAITAVKQRSRFPSELAAEKANYALLIFQIVNLMSRATLKKEPVNLMVRLIKDFEDLHHFLTAINQVKNKENELEFESITSQILGLIWPKLEINNHYCIEFKDCFQILSESNQSIVIEHMKGNWLKLFPDAESFNQTKNTIEQMKGNLVELFFYAESKKMIEQMLAFFPENHQAEMSAISNDLTILHAMVNEWCEQTIKPGDCTVFLRKFTTIDAWADQVRMLL